MIAEPLVSILVPTYNRERYISECLQSALNQTYRNLEVIVVDNASSDSTWNIVGEIAAHDRRVRRFRNEVNLGPVRNWERCLAEARGELAKFLWSDDLIAPTFISKTVPWLRDNPEVGFVCTGLEIFCDSHRRRDSVYRIGRSGFYHCQAYRQGVLADRRFPPSPGCALFRLSDLRRNLTVVIPNRYNIDLAVRGVGADLLLYLKTSLSYPYFAFVDERLAFFRDHPDSITTASRMGAVPLLNALAKTHFLETSSASAREIHRHNAYLYLLLKIFTNNNIGFRGLKCFYFNTKPDLAIDWSYMMWIGVRYSCHELAVKMGRITSALKRPTTVEIDRSLAMDGRPGLVINDQKNITVIP